jgi:hypothetical protein
MPPSYGNLDWDYIGRAFTGKPEPVQFNGPDTRPMPSVGEDEDTRERDWHDLETAAREFIKTYGVSAMLRCVSRAIEGE